MQEIRCFITHPFDCSYLPNRQSRNLVIDPALPLTTELLGTVLDIGFRRSGEHLYRPHCAECQACIPVRISSHSFKPDRSQRRCWRDNQVLEHRTTTGFAEEQFALYKRYLDSRHSGSSMADTTPTEYIGFLTAEGVDTRFHEFRLDGRLAAVAVTDHTPAGLSAVYTFYDPELHDQGLGTYAILWQIHHARELGLAWVYLGFWISDCDKMKYKRRFRPAQGFLEERWQPLI